MVLFCRACGSSNLRVSKLHKEDLTKLFRLKYPVRCRACRERGLVSIFQLSAVLRNRKSHL
jgi:ribosomal protein L40E